MAYLVDTHTLLWAANDNPRLSRLVVSILLDPENVIHASAVSGFELANKYRTGKLPQARVLVEDFENLVRRLGFRLLPLTGAHAVRAGLYPAEHRDPFDRFLAAQAQTEHMAVLSLDPQLDQFGIRRVW